MFCPAGDFLTVMNEPGETIDFSFVGGNMACSKMIEVKCGAPSFRIRESVGVNYDEFLVYYLEYDASKITGSTTGIDPNADIHTQGAMGVKVGMARNDQTFYYAGKGSDSV